MSTSPTGNAPEAGPPKERRILCDRYELLASVGHGGMSLVHRARDRLTGDTVALKYIGAGPIGPAGWEAGKARRLTLAREFSTLATLRHPNIISVLDFGFAEDGEPFFTMELLERSRTVLEAAKAVAPARRIELVLEILRALSYLHRRGVIHRDLKPSNVLVDDRVRLLDFGIAIHRGEGANASGTLSHMAPEVLRGDPSTEAADLYAVGVMAYEMFAGHHPHRGFIGEALRKAVLTSDPDLAAIDGTLALQRLIDRLLAKDPDRRHASADEAIDALIEAAGLDVPRHTRATRESFLQAASFVDRTEEQAALSTALSSLMTHRRGGVWMVEGESGIGKTRLLDELRTLALVNGAKVVRGQADSDARGAFELWREPLRHLLLGTTMGAGEASSLLALVPDVGALLGQTVTAAPVDPQTARAQMMRAIGTVFECQRTPVLLILDDLQWAHEGLEVLRELAPRLGELPVLIVGSFRAEEAPSLAQTIPGASHLRLGPLAREHIADLARSMLGTERPDVVEFLHPTEGQPLFVIETVRELEESGSLEQVGVTSFPEELRPRGIGALVARRLARVSDAVRPLLTFAAVAGRVIDQPVLVATFGVAPVDETLALGAELHLLEVRDNRFRFAHDKFRQHILQALDAADRRELHRAVAGAIERVHGGGKGWAAALAYHHREAGQPEREAPFSALAGQAALEQGAYGEATRLLERALALYDAHPAADRKAELDAWLNYGAVIIATHSWTTPEVQRIYDRVIPLANELGAHETIPAMHGQAAVWMFRGAFTTARELAVTYGKLAEDVGDVVGRIQAALILANVATWLGRHDEAEVMHQRIIELYEPGQLEMHVLRYGWNPRVVGLVTHAVSSCIAGDPARAVALYREAIEMARASEHSWTLAIAYQIGAWVHHLRREVDETRRYAELLGEVAGKHGFPAFMVLADALGGWAMVMSGEPAGLDRVRSAIARWGQMGSKMVTTFYATHLAESCLAVSAVDEAIELVSATLADESTTQERCYHAELYRLLGEGSRRKGDLERAASALTRAVTLATEQGAQLFEWRALCGLARLDRAGPRELERLRELRAKFAQLPEAADDCKPPPGPKSPDTH